jgi:hypothetical protein
MGEGVRKDTPVLAFEFRDWKLVIGDWFLLICD